MFNKAAALVAATHLLAASAHLFIQSPTPIEGSAPKDPLAPNGANFPCHGATLPSSGGIKMAVGEPQLLKFDNGGGLNTAVHGGGSCQLSITYETDANKVRDPKNWYVIYSIEGGCPTNSLMNLDTTYGFNGAFQCGDDRAPNDIDCLNQFNFTIPRGVKNGHAILAWTWYNNVGNRELYMNCVNTQLTGGDGSEMDQFPTLFYANIPQPLSPDEPFCPTTASMNVQFPYPGKYVTTRLPSGASEYPLAKPTGAGCAGDGALVSGGGGGQPEPTPLSSSAAVPSSSSSFIPAPSSSPGPEPSSTRNAPQPSPTNGVPPSGTCPNGRLPCSAPGSLFCIGKYQFGICDIDNCMIPRPLAPGTQCTAGRITKRSHIRRAAIRAAKQRRRRNL